MRDRSRRGNKGIGNSMGGLNAINTEERSKLLVNSRSPSPPSLNHSPEEDMFLRTQ